MFKLQKIVTSLRGAAAVACGVALVPGPHQAPFIVACAAASRGANRL